MVKSERDEGEDGEPDAHDLGREVTALHSEEAGQSDEPVAANTAEEYHAEVRSDLLLGGEGDDSRLEGVVGENLAVCKLWSVKSLAG